MRHDCLAVTARIEADRDGRKALVLDDRRCTGCVGCFWRAPERLDLGGLVDGRALAPGLAVVLRLPVATALAASMLLYGLPLAAILVGAYLGAAHGDAVAVLGAVSGLGVAALVMRLVGARVERRICDRLTVSAS